jgi:hypothetical protein
MSIDSRFGSFRNADRPYRFALAPGALIGVHARAGFSLELRACGSLDAAVLGTHHP